jgi:hypothetical protein
MQESQAEGISQAASKAKGINRGASYEKQL